MHWLEEVAIALDEAPTPVAFFFRLLSREWRARPLGLPGLAELPVRIDWVRRDKGARGTALVDAIQGRQAVGIMFHHAVMRAREADDLLGLVAEHERACPLSMLDAAGQSCRSCERGGVARPVRYA